MVIRRKGQFYIYFRPFKDKKIGLQVDVVSKTEAKAVEVVLKKACRTGDYRGLDSTSREACIRMFRNQGWEIPAELAGDNRPQDVLTLIKGSELFLTSHHIKDCSEKPRYKLCFLHLLEHFGRDADVKSIWLPDIRAYIAERSSKGVSPSQVNREKGTLSKMFQHLVELRLIEANPCALIKNLSQKSEERQVYLSREDVEKIAGKCPHWFQAIIWTAYYSGMRRGEILNLRRSQVRLDRRMILLGPEDTKEHGWKRVPIHRNLVPVLEETKKVTCLGADKVFLLKDGQAVRPLEMETFKNPWPRACEALEKAKELSKPFPRFHDLRHTWRANARRSGMDPAIAESILGHWFRGRTVNERYGRIGDEELLKAIDSMTFDHGSSEILVARARS
jgi:integrase